MKDYHEPVFHRLGGVATEAFFIYHINSRKFNYLGPGFASYFDTPIDELAENPEQLLAAVYPDDRDYLYAQLAAFEHLKQVRAEFRLVTRDSAAVYVQLTAYELPGDDGLSVGWLTNIDNIKNNILYAEKINARKNSLLEILSHDLKEPVSMINMMASAIKRDSVVAANQTLLNYVQVIQDLCESNIRLIRGLVQQEFLEANEIGIRMERADLVWCVQDVMRQYEASAPVTKKQFRFVTDRPKLLITMDTLKMIQVVNNLIANAIKFTNNGGLIEVRISSGENTARISVIDDGIGIPPELKPYIFEPHSRAQRPGIRGEEGSGMGLSIIHSLVELHNGRIWLDTQQLKGTTFHIELPLT